MGGGKFEDKLFSSTYVADKESQSTLPNPRRAVRFDETTKHQPSPRPYSDSQLRSRMSQPGSRKYKRFLNNVELLETALSDSEGEEFEIEVEFRVEFRSPFSVIFEDDEFRRDWEPFLEVTEEEENRLLALLEQEAFRKTQKKSRGRDTTVGTECFKNLSRYARKTLFEHSESPVFAALDKRVVDFILARHHTRTLPLTSHFQRLLCHCIAPYYSMTAKTIKSGATYYTTLTKSKATRLPEPCLYQFIQTRKEEKLR